jgi:hypothetical protein
MSYRYAFECRGHPQYFDKMKYNTHRLLAHTCLKNTNNAETIPCSISHYINSTLASPNFSRSVSNDIFVSGRKSSRYFRISTDKAHSAALLILGFASLTAAMQCDINFVLVSIWTALVSIQNRTEQRRYRLPARHVANLYYLAFPQRSQSWQDECGYHPSSTPSESLPWSLY